MSMELEEEWSERKSSTGLNNSSGTCLLGRGKLSTLELHLVAFLVSRFGLMPSRGGFEWAFEDRNWRWSEDCREFKVALI